MGCVDGENCALSLAGHLETTGLSKETVVCGPWTWGRAVRTDGLGGSPQPRRDLSVSLGRTLIPLSQVHKKVPQ